MNRHVLVPALAVFVLAACGGDPDDPAGQPGATGPNAWLVELQQRPEYRDACEETPGCQEAMQPLEGPQEPIWRVQIIRDASGNISIGRIDSVLVPQDKGIPPGKATGDYLLVGVDSDGNPVDGQLIQFPSTLRLEFEDRTNRPQEIDLSDKRVDTIGYVRGQPEIQSIEIRDEENAVIASAIPPAPLQARAAPHEPGFSLISRAHAAAPTTGLPPDCTHIRILQGEPDREYAGTLAFNEQIAELRVPEPFQLAAVTAALGRMKPMLCGAIGRIAFARMEEMEDYAVGAVLQAGEGDIIMINEASYPESELENKSDPRQQQAAERRRLLLQTTVLHETGHAVEALLNASGSNPMAYGGDWDVPARARAVTALTHARMQKGFGREWQRIHESFVSAGWARPYIIAGLLIPLADEKVVSGGFMTSYGSNIWWDDIAEYLSETYMGPVFRSERFSSYDLACKAMQAWSQPSVPSGLAPAYTKLMFLRDMNLVEKSDVKACVGNHLGLQSMAKGLHFWLDGTHYRSFTQNLKAGIGTEAILQNRVFTLEGEGEAGFGGDTYPAKLTLRLDLGSTFDDINEVSWPRGVYELGLTGDNNVQLVLDGAKAANFDAMDGFVLVAEASNKRITGSIVLQRVMRLQAPLPIPEKYDPPLVIRFKLEN